MKKSLLALAAVLTLGVGCGKVDKLIANFGDDTPEVLAKRTAEVDRINAGQAAQLQITLKHTVVASTSFKNAFTAALPDVDLAQHCIQWKEYTDNEGTAAQVELHTTPCPSPAAPLGDDTKVAAVNIAEVDRGNTGQFADYDLSRNGTVLGQIFFNDARTEEQGKAILNSTCQVHSQLNPDYSSACELKNEDGKLALEMK